MVDGYQEKSLSEYSEDEGNFDGQSISIKHASCIDANQSTLIEVTHNHLDSRFASIRESALAKACTIFNPSLGSGFEDFEENELTCIAQQFGENCVSVQNSLPTRPEKY